MAIHIDTDGNFWFGQTGTEELDEISYTPVFSVTNAGVLTASSGTVGGWTLGSTTLTATDNLNNSITLNSNGTISANYSQASTGYELNADGSAEFNGPILQFGKDTGSGTPSTASSDRIKIGDAVLFNRDVSSTSSLVSTKSFLVLPDGDEDNPSLAIDGQHGTLGFFVDTPLSGISRMQITNGADNVASWSTSDSSFTVPDKLVLGGTLQAGGGVGSSGQVLQSTGTGVQWANAGGSHADSDHTSFANSSHTHTESDITNIGAHGHSYDNYNYWRLREDGNNVGTVSSTQSFSINSGTGISVTSGGGGGDHSITITNTATGSSGVTSVSGSNSSSSDGRFMRSTALAVGGTTLYYYTSTRGDNLTIQGQRPTSNNTSSVGLSATQYNEVHARYGYFDFITGGNVSSQEVKTDITDLDLGLDFINSLAPKKYKYKPELKEDDGKYGFGFIAEEIETLLSNEGESNSKLHQDGHTDYPNYGRCAHELVCTCEDPECCPEPVLTYNRETEEWTEIEGCDKDAKCTMPCCTDIVGTTIDGINYVHATEEECEQYYIDGRKYSSVIKEELIAPLVKAVQELSTQISDLTARVEALEG